MSFTGSFDDRGWRTRIVNREPDEQYPHGDDFFTRPNFHGTNCQCTVEPVFGPVGGSGASDAKESGQTDPTAPIQDRDDLSQIIEAAVRKAIRDVVADIAFGGAR